MTYLSRRLLRQIILEAQDPKRKAPLLGFNSIEDDEFPSGTEDTLNIDHSTKTEEVPLPEFGDYFEDDFDLSFMDDEEESYTEEAESETVESLHGLPFAGYHPVYRNAHLAPDETSRVDPEGRTIGQITQDVFDAHDEYYTAPTKKTRAQEEAEFLEKMNSLSPDTPPAEFPADPEFDFTSTIKIDHSKDKDIRKPVENEEDTGSLEETINRLIRESIRRKLKSRSKFNRRRIQ